MIRFDNDYTRGMHPRILQRLTETNMEQTPGYGTDHYCESAANHIKKACNNQDIDVHFMVGGTLANLTIIGASLRPHEAVISPSSGHIFTSETGAIEATGHKVITIPTTTGKITADQIHEILKKPENVHSPKPGMIYLSQSTELGGIYTKAELQAIKSMAGQYDVPLFVDGARLGQAMAAESCDVTLEDMAELCDVFYIGGTKVGALFGEAVVITNDRLKKDFRYLMKQRGGLFAKGRILGVQFEELFKDGLYFEVSKYAVDLAMKLKDAVLEAGLNLAYPAVTNQVFIELTHRQFEKLSEKYAFIPWEKHENHVVGRFCTDWSTLPEHVEELIGDLK